MMIKYFVLILTFIFAIFVSNGAYGYEMPIIVEGTLSVSGQFPWIVFVETPTEYTCVGTIVDAWHVVTSAECVVDKEGKLWNPFWFKITAGTIDLFNINSRSVTRKLIGIFVHERYNVLTRENDLAVLRVDSPFPDPHNTIEEAEIFPNAPVTNICQFAGWSPSSYKDNTVQQHFYGVRIQNWSVCGNNVKLNNVVCGRSVRRSNSCQGNMGSGLFCDRQLIGIFSYGRSCNDTVVPSVYTDIRKFKSWIITQFSRTDIPKPGSYPSE